MAVAIDAVAFVIDVIDLFLAVGIVAVAFVWCVVWILSVLYSGGCCSGLWPC